MDNQALPCFLDFEASSLRDISHPIEAAWSLEDGAVEAYLIKPAWDWSDWDSNAEAVHGISQQELIEKGLPAWHLARRMNEALAGKTLHSDAPEYDGFWLERLFEHHNEEPQFTLRHFDALFPRLSPDRVAAQAQIARYRVAGRQHRAAHDVQFLIELYRILRAE